MRRRYGYGASLEIRESPTLLRKSVGLARREETAPLISVPAARDIEEMLDAGELRCPCSGVLGRWGFAVERSIRGIAGTVRPRRVICRDCGVTHVLLPSTCFARRADSAERVGLGISAAAGGADIEVIADELGAPAETIRGWVRRVRTNAGAVVAFLSQAGARADPAWSYCPKVDLSKLASVVDVVGAVVAAVGRSTQRVLKMPVVAVWQVVALITGGKFLSPSLPVG